ncbi:protein FAR1-RELATED SEQUENCE 3-like [Setaria viridis]|uniref:protein FAR1-RELATED SEQUENCE 3-like n=1 Tax=Setaria viridis TaxID=4556 RepID=UPI003B3A303A
MSADASDVALSECGATAAEARAPAVGMVFPSPAAALKFYLAYAARVGFRVRKSKSSTSGHGDAVIMRRFAFSRQGLPARKDPPLDPSRKRRDRASSRAACPAMIQSTALGPDGNVTQCLLEHFKKKQSENPPFCYAIQVDRSNCVTNFLWEDARARLLYKWFGDAVVLDVTCKRNLPAAPFVAQTGLNHHRQVIVFGYAILTDESEETQRLCQRDIFSRCKERLAAVYEAHPSFKQELKECVNELERIDEFESKWRFLLNKYNLTVWLTGVSECIEHLVLKGRDALFT